MPLELFRVAAVRSNGQTESLQTDSRERADALFATYCNDDHLFATICELGFGGTSDAQWVIVNRYARDVQGWV